MSWLAEKILLALSRDETSPDLPTKTGSYTVENALGLAVKTVPGFEAMIMGKSILDYGCGPGWQAVAMARKGARFVYGLDTDPYWLSLAADLIRKVEQTGVQFGQSVPDSLRGSFDIAVSISAFEHFAEPARELATMRSMVRPGGRVILSWAEPWYSHSGSHMNFFTRMPWVNVCFSEKTVMRVRARFRNDGATRYEDIQGGLNKMTLQKFSKIIGTCGMPVERLEYFSTLKIPLVKHIPGLREFFVASVACVLQRN